MLRLATIACVIVSCLGAVPRDSIHHKDGRIAGGVDANIADYPYMASVEMSLSHKCGGAIINTDFVLTAANRVYGQLVNGIAVRVGTDKTGEGGFRTSAFKVIIHEAYNPSKAGNDIALIEVVGKLPLGPTIQPIPMTFNTPAEGVVTTITGWDATTPHPRPLKVVQAPVTNKDTCVKQYDGYYVPTKIFCAGLTDGDLQSRNSETGGPVVANGELVGLISDYGCFDANLARIHTDVASYRPWINVYTNE